MELLTEKQVAELIVEYENKNKEWVEKIKQELQNRKELKKKLEEAKQREAVQLQVLERYEESEKMVKKELELVAKMEDNESLKQLAVIKKYEDMLAEQKEMWELYKEQYENLPSVKKVRGAEAELLCSNIQLALKVQKMKDVKRMVQLRELVRKKQEQARIIKLAEMYAKYMRRERHCRELWDQNKKLTVQALHLRQELQEREKAKQQKLSVELEKASELMRPQQLPQVDLSHFIIHRDKGNDKLDTMSINSYILEEEYMNNNGQSISKLNSSQNKAMDVDTQDSMHMDVDTQEADSREGKRAESNETPRRLDFKGAFDDGDNTQCAPSAVEPNDNEMQSHMQSNSSSQPQSQVDENNRTYDQNMSSQESQTSDKNGNQHSARKRASQKPSQNEEDATMHVSFASNENTQNACPTPFDRPIPTPAKMTKSSFQEKHPRFQQTTKQEHRNRQDTSQQNQNQQVSNRSSRDIQQHQKRSSQEMIQQQQQSSRHSSQENYQQQQKSREMYQQNQQQQTPRYPSQEKYQQNQQQQTPRNPTQNQQQQQTRPPPQEMYQQQQTPRHPPQDMYQQNQQQQQTRPPPQEMYQQQQTPRHPPQDMYQQNQQQQQSRQPPQEMYQQTPRQETYLRNEQQPTQVSLQNSEQMDFSRLPTSKPRIIANEFVNYDLQALQRKQTNEIQPKAQTTSQTPMETPTAKNVAPPKNESTPFAYQVPFATSSQTNVNVTPISAEIHPSSMMSTTMHSIDSNYLIPDNISAILGSEITEPGGSFELARRLHDTDSISNLSDVDYDAMMKTLCSPIHKVSPKAQQPQAPENVSTQPPAINQNTQDSNTNSNDRAFTFGGFTKKQTNKFF